MRVLCVARHQILSEHFCRYFDALGVDTLPCVGIADALNMVRAEHPDAVVCDYDLLTTISLETWESDRALSRVPVIAVSLTRKPNEAQLSDYDSLAGFAYLPKFAPEDAHQLLTRIREHSRGINPPNVLPWPPTTSVARQR